MKMSAEFKALASDIFQRFLCLAVYMICLIPPSAMLMAEFITSPWWMVGLVGSWLLEMLLALIVSRLQAARKLNIIVTILCIAIVFVGLNALASCLLIQSHQITVPYEEISLRAMRGELTESEIYANRNHILTPEEIEATRASMLVMTRILLTAITFIGMMVAYGLSSLKPEIFAKGQLIFGGMLVLSIEALMFKEVAGLIYGCFAAFIVGVFLLMMLLVRRNRFVALIGMAVIVVVALAIAFFSSELGTIVRLIYEYILAPVLLGVVWLASLVIRLFRFRDSDDGGPRLIDTPEPDASAVPTPDLLEQANKSLADQSFNGVMIFFAIVIIAVVIIAIYLLTRMHRKERLARVEEHEQRRALTQEEIRDLLRQETRQSDTGVGLAKKLRRLMYTTLRRMYTHLYPISYANTTDESQTILNRGLQQGAKRELFRLYNRVRYGDMPIDEKELQAAEQEVKQIRKDMNDYYV